MLTDPTPRARSGLESNPRNETVRCRADYNICIYTYLYIYIYRERERSTYIYIYIYICIHTININIIIIIIIIMFIVIITKQSTARRDAARGGEAT